MRKFYYSLLALAMMMVGTTVKAQEEEPVASNPKLSELSIEKEYEMPITFYQGKAYEGKSVSVALDGIYEALGTTADEFDADAANNVWTQVVGENGLLDELQLPAAASGGAWFGRYNDAVPYQSVPMGWGTTIKVGEGEEATTVYLNTFYLQDFSLANGEFTVGSTGQYEQPVMNPGDGDYADLYIVNGTKAVKVKVVANVKEPLDVPFTKEIASLNILSEKETSVDVVYGKNAVATVDVNDIIQALKTMAALSQTAIPDITAEDIDNVIGDLTAAEMVGEEDGYPSGELLQLSAHDWLAFDYDEVKNNCYVTDMSGEVSYNAFEVWEPALSDDGIYSIVVDLSAKQMQAGETKTADLYLVYGTYGVKIKLTVNVVEPEKKELTKVGETTIQVSAEIDDSYATKPFTVDMSEVLQTLGCEASDLDDIYAWEEEGLLYDGTHTEGSGGWYLSDEGFVASWGSGSAFFVALNGDNAVQNGTYTIGQMSGHFTNIEEDTTVKAQLLYIYESNYFAVNIEYTVTLPVAPPEEYSIDDEFGEIVAVIPVTMQLKPSDLYYAQEDEETQKMMQKDFNVESVKALLGEGSYTFYGLKTPKSADSTPTLQTSGGYGTNEGFNGGFWMAKPNAELGEEYVNTAFAAGWGDNAYGIEWNLETGIFGFDQFPGANQVGDSYKSTFYWALADNSKAIKYLLTVEYVEEPVDVPITTVIASYEETQEVELTEDNMYEFPINKAYLMEQFGLTEEEELESVEVRIAAGSGYYDEAESALIDSEGYITEEPADGTPIPFGNADLYVDLFDMGTITYAPYADPDGEQEFEKGMIRIAFDYEDQRIIYTVTVATAEYIATGINSISNKPVSTARYNVAGQKVNAAYKGIVIENGKKKLVK